MTTDTRSAEQIEADNELFRRTGIDPREVHLLRNIYADPSTKREAQRLIAKVAPQTRDAMPELLVQEEYEKASAEFRKERDEWRSEREKDQQERRRLSAIKDAMDDPGVALRAHEVAEVEKIMTGRLIGNYKDATRLYRAETNVAAPRVSDPTVWLPGQQDTDDEYFKKLWNTPLGSNGAAQRDKLANQEAHRMAQEFRTGEGSRKYASLMVV